MCMRFSMKQIAAARCRWKKFLREFATKGGDTKRVRVGQGGGDGGRRERAAWPRPSGLPPSSLTPSHNYPFPKPHNTQPTPPLLRVSTRSDHSMSAVVLLL